MSKNTMLRCCINTAAHFRWTYRLIHFNRDVTDITNVKLGAYSSELVQTRAWLSHSIRTQSLTENGLSVDLLCSH